jgi:hypothetical protein
VIGGEISSSKQVMRWLAPCHDSTTEGEAGHSSRLQTAGGGEAP